MTRVANAKLLDMVSVADVDTEERVDGSLVMILQLRFGKNQTKLLLISGRQSKVWHLNIWTFEHTVETWCQNHHEYLEKENICFAENNKIREERGGKYFSRGEEKWRRKGREDNIWISRICFFAEKKTGRNSRKMFREGRF